ncbi:MAG: hypothetical protein A2Z25_11475 [Planctomycetes bacterium RBG_16_55_9]|nr:MAG: hypothetical protein A2Z25_11475 [Planctomycetes bacterium RBG_16_55_9]
MSHEGTKHALSEVERGTKKFMIYDWGCRRVDPLNHKLVPSEAEGSKIENRNFLVSSCLYG